MKITKKIMSVRTILEKISSGEIYGRTSRYREEKSGCSDGLRDGYVSVLVSAGANLREKIAPGMRIHPFSNEIFIKGRKASDEEVEALFKKEIEVPVNSGGFIAVDFM